MKNFVIKFHEQTCYEKLIRPSGKTDNYFAECVKTISIKYKENKAKNYFIYTV